MKTIEELQWDAFPLINIFDISATKSSIDRIKLTGEKGIYPYLTRSDKDNGMDSFIGNQPKYERDEENVITIGLDTQTVFYQPYSFYTGQNIQILRLKDKSLNRHIALFMIPLIKKQMEKFNWGGNGATLGRLKKISLTLPKIDEDTPDYQYMEEYMKEKEKKFLLRYKDYIDKQKSEALCDVGEKKKWIGFSIDDVFHVYPGVRLIKDDMIEGITPFVGATDSNNGITAFCGNTNKSLDSNVLGVNYNGSVVENFYHPYKALFSDDVKRLHLKDIENDKYTCLFIKSCILKQKKKFEYGYKFNGERMKEQKIMLPVDSDDNPDYKYMQDRMKLIEKRIISRYINFRLGEVDK